MPRKKRSLPRVLHFSTATRPAALLDRRLQEPDQSYVFIIDEINRGNLSRIFGELLMLIEPDKRGEEFSIPLTYSRLSDERFFVPENVYLIGTMNTADRSLALVDYALRRRFAFIDVKPAFSNPKFHEYLSDRGVSETIAKTIIDRMLYINAIISEHTKDLGPGYQIGHSYFCPRDGVALDQLWYEAVIRSEVGPLIREYWFEDEAKAEGFINDLLQG